MNRAVVIILFAILYLYSAPGAASAAECLSCHGKQGAKGYVDPASYADSVHKAVRCSGCHIDVTSYPHNSEIIKVQCGICHLLGREGAPAAQAQQYKLSVHGKAVLAGNSAAPLCQTCHGSHYILPSKDLRSATNRLKIPALCSQCHPAEYRVYSGSIHGKEFLEKNNPSAATCFDCHMEHRISKIDEQWKLALINECGSCHSEEMDTYHKTYHGKVTKLGYTTVAKCSDCHGSHDILPAYYKTSTISDENIVSTCRRCHPKATASFAKFYAHPEENNRAKYPVLYYTYKFMTLLLIGVFTFFFAHTILWAYRALREKMQSRKRGR